MAIITGKVNHFGLPLPRKFKECMAGLKSKKSA